MLFKSFNPKQLEIPDCWKVIKNHFMDLEPDNTHPIDDVFFVFDEDILYATYKDYSIDLGFYGGYTNDRAGFFKVVIFKGDFNYGEYFEFFISRSTDEIKNKLNFYFKSIPEGKLDNLTGLIYDDDYDFRSFHVYSTIENISYRLTREEVEEIAKPKTI